MGVVWLAHDRSLDTPVALKFLASHLRWDCRALGELRREVNRARSLSHPGIVRIHDLHEDESGAAIAMEYLSGGSLADLLALRLKATPPAAIEVEEMAAWLDPLAAALDYAHCESRLIHRDLKPSNLLLTAEGRPKIADFGVSRMLAEATSRTSGVFRAGTLAYMSPQQLHDEPATPADDIHALGATLYDLLAGSPPFRQGDLARQIETRMPESIAARRAATGISGRPVPRKWEDAIRTCLAKRPQRRPRTAGDLAKLLRAASGGKRARRRPEATALRTAAIVLLVIVFVVGAAIFERLRRRDGQTGRLGSEVQGALVAWDLDGDGHDVSGRGLDAVALRTVPCEDRFGRIDRALRFNGTAGLDVASSPKLSWSGSEAFSVGLWVKPGGNSGEEAPLISALPSRPQALLWRLSLSRGRPTFTIDGHPRARAVSVSAARMLSEDRWSAIVVVSDGRHVRLLVNGQQVGETGLGDLAAADAAGEASIRIGQELNAERALFSGDLDEIRIWRRALAPAEAKDFSAPEAPPRFLLSRVEYGDRDDLAAELKAEFGGEAELADWSSIGRWHRERIRVWVEEVGLALSAPGAFVQCRGQRAGVADRQYFVTRFDGAVPDYYGVHEEYGGRTLVLGSWRGTRMSALAQLPHWPPRRETVVADAAGEIVRRWGPGEVPECAAGMARFEVVRGMEARRASFEAGLREGVTMRGELEWQGDGMMRLALFRGTELVRSRAVGPSFGTHTLAVVLRGKTIHFRVVRDLGGVAVAAERLAIEGSGRAEVDRLRFTGVDAVNFTIE